MHQLICEGSCNPERLVLDQKVHAFRSQRIAKGIVSSVPDLLVHSLRTLRHTGHIHVASGTFRCTECGTPRRFGGDV